MFSFNPMTHLNILLLHTRGTKCVEIFIHHHYHLFAACVCLWVYKISDGCDIWQVTVKMAQSCVYFAHEISWMQDKPWNFLSFSRNCFELAFYHRSLHDKVPIWLTRNVTRSGDISLVIYMSRLCGHWLCVHGCFVVCCINISTDKMMQEHICSSLCCKKPMNIKPNKQPKRPRLIKRHIISFLTVPFKIIMEAT